VPGRVRSPSRRPLLEPVAIAAIGALALVQAFGPDPLTGVGTTLDPIENPLNVPALSDATRFVMDVVPLIIVGYAALGWVCWHGTGSPAGNQRTRIAGRGPFSGCCCQ